ncbi:protein of unknown function DUF901 [Desulfofarcimen acetoxidans DSM 771]|uniref:NYN domain-containing protein n=1 Tax=Desulfofarcimen acetoxidans (strain ATCC 49208 / DSM 771 / KCTC 5769 / VKM B-1644 / 5575) TaxID=485916 RepID=C8W3W7_DESAS|nr:NYN domain-containing protein [Desulfofarcimen acetoxidans]ACV61221.1 protein of unknown function DUF901 [Desulfofarcimen acetoxidans DSM 771]
MKEYLVIDGYNVIYTWPKLARLSDTSLEHARVKLVDIMASHSALSGQLIKVVFDAHQVKNITQRQEQVNGIEILYTQQGETADALIERITGDLIKLGKVYVVTSDWDEQRIIFGRGAYRMTPRELWEQVKKIRQKNMSEYSINLPTEGYLENRLNESVRDLLEKLRRKKF